jgi:hypothetical protein
MRSSTISPSGVVSSRSVKALPGPIVVVWTRLAAKIRSVAFVGVAEPLLLVTLLPLLAEEPSTGLLGSAPVYSSIRMSADIAPVAKVTVTVFVPAAAAAMFFA